LRDLALDVLFSEDESGGVGVVAGAKQSAMTSAAATRSLRTGAERAANSSSLDTEEGPSILHR
jgi:hypothetical protein